MTDSQRNQILEALEAWRVAEQAYSDEFRPYLAGGWVTGGTLAPPDKTPDSEAFKELKRLRKAADDALRDFERRCGT